ncbi:ATP-binding protein (plasmid) [Haloferax mediterranei ATCC 33500]|nr:ATP-binding protein [Haloferax mediterranei]AHZ24657.1 hypothetical protein BM92_17350 [Haloferax mediterranei ATCC 33500]ELZ97429.1 hypothetical protein C439_18943 [Haloferax mediterranei ATCC 33500]MDX5990276.1 ATP-binding protein [Haloferax mediterranei ATCC 33500]QCQ77053.1 ATP-binding protein [Haloferax mediterranei ATCC 33500]
MEDQLYPSDVKDWTWDTIEFLADNDVPESTYLEYKKHLSYPTGENSDKSKQKWRRNLEREFTAFANGCGGILVFGMADSIDPAPFEPPEHEVRRTVNQYIKDTTPVVEIYVSDPLIPPSENTDRIALAVRVFEASRKPVKASDSSYFVRVNDQKQPMSREQLESMFVEADRRQQAVRQLEFEISRFVNSFEENIEEVPNRDHIPPLEAVDEQSLRGALRQNTHLFSDENIQEDIIEVMGILDEISSAKREFDEGCRNMGRVEHDSYSELNKVTQVKIFDLSCRLDSKLRDVKKKTQLEFP